MRRVKFRYKVILCNVILLSLGLAMAGYLMIRRNFGLALDTQIRSGIANNNLVQSSVENQLLREISDRVPESGEISEKLGQIGRQTEKNLPEKSGKIYIRYDNEMVYGEQEEEFSNLFTNLEVGTKRYTLKKTGESVTMYVTSCAGYEGSSLQIISSSDVSPAYQMLSDQTTFFRWIAAAIVLIVSAIIYVISRLLTAPLEHLAKLSDEIARGHYSRRIQVRTRDEVGTVSERFNEMAHSVEQHIDRLEEMVHQRDQFVADFTHEIKTPMTSIIGYADTMRTVSLTDGEKKMALDYIFSEGKRLENLSVKLLDLIFLRRDEIEMEEVPVSVLIHDVEKSVRPLLEQSGVALETDYEDAKIQCSREWMVTVFINLIDNAKKASGRGQKIILGDKIQSDEQGRHTYEFTVRDFGIGMSGDVVNHICDEFYMADKSRARKAGGAGLGMSIVKNILRQHDAAIEIQSEEGRGTKITIRFEAGRCSV